MGKQEDLNRLFDEWRCIASGSSHPFEIFVEDGIVNEALFANTRILFVLKDLHLDEKGRFEYLPLGKIDMRKHVFDKEDWRTWNPIALWSKALLDGPETLDQLETSDKIALRRKYLPQISFINLKKEAGNSTVPDACVLCYAKMHAEQIRSEIEIIDPDIIIACGPAVFEALHTCVFIDRHWENDDRVNLCSKMSDYGNLFNVNTEAKPVYVVKYHHPTNRGRGSCTQEEHYANMCAIRKHCLPTKD